MADDTGNMGWGAFLQPGTSPDANWNPAQALFGAMMPAWPPKSPTMPTPTQDPAGGAPSAAQSAADIAPPLAPGQAVVNLNQPPQGSGGSSAPGVGPWSTSVAPTAGWDAMSPASQKSLIDGTKAGLGAFGQMEQQRQKAMQMPPMKLAPAPSGGGGAFTPFRVVQN